MEQLSYMYGLLRFFYSLVLFCCGMDAITILLTEKVYRATHQGALDSIIFRSLAPKVSLHDDLTCDP